MSRSVRPLDLALLIAFVSVTAGGAVAWAFWSLQLLQDPAEVVGVPLLTGYAEKNEQYGFYLFVASTALVAWCGSKLLSTRHVNDLVGPVLGLSMVCFPAAAGSPARYVPLTFAVVAIFATGRWWVAARRHRIIRWTMIFFAATLVVVSHPDLFEMAGNGTLVSCLVVITTLVVLLVGMVARARGWSREQQGLTLLTLAVLFLAISSEGWYMLLATGSVVFIAGVLHQRQEGRSSHGWILAAGLLVLLLYRLGMPLSSWHAPTARFLGAAATCLIIMEAWPQSFTASLLVFQQHAPIGIKRISHKSYSAFSGRLLPVFGASCLLIPFTNHKWYALVVTLLLLAILVPAGGRGSRWLRLSMVLGLLLVAFLPSHMLPRDVDLFHDGQILSAVWEFESGRELYTEVFPLRGYDFFLTLVQRQLLPDTVAAYQLVFHLANLMVPAWALLLAYSWTRNVPWSVATACVLTTCTPMDSRQGLHLFFAAAVLSAIRQKGWKRWILLIVSGTVSWFLGYDVAIPLSLATVAAFYVNGPASCDKLPRQESDFDCSHVKPSHWRFLQTLISRLFPAAIYLSITVMSFSFLVFAWQGSASVLTYWRLLFDYASNYPAFYGLPIEWRDGPSRRLVATALTALGFAIAWGIYWYKDSSPFKRSAWCFVVVQTVFISHRWLGRSDLPHLTAVSYPSILLFMLLMYEVISTIRRLHRIRLDVRLLAGGVVLLICLLAVPGQSVFSFVQTVQSMLNSKQRIASQSTFIYRATNNNDYVWDIENGYVNFEYQRHNPTRHAIAYCIGSPDEQREAVKALEKNAPKLIIWTYGSGSDKIANPLRFYVMAPYLFSRFRPEENDLLVLAESHWPGVVELDAHLTGPLHLQWLAESWGRRRLSDIREGSQADLQLVVASDRDSNCSHCTFDVRPRDWDYLYVRLYSPRSDPSAQCILEFAQPGRDFESASMITFRLVPGESDYLIPIGCSPSWSWRPAMNRIRILSEQGPLRVSKARFYRFDDAKDPRLH